MGLKVLIVGSGGREHAFAKIIGKSPLVDKVLVAPGNGGTQGGKIERVNISAKEINSLLQFAKENGIDLTVVGPEDPLCNGIVNLFHNEGLKIFGPSSRAAHIEGSKVYTRWFLSKYGIPQPGYRIFRNPDCAKKYVHNKDLDKFPVVIKVDGLAAGKGVIIAKNLDEAIDAIDRIMRKREFGDAGKRILIEEYLTGREVSYFVLTDGTNIISLPTAQDYKRIGDGDTGPNTGGMGGYSPSRFVDEIDEEFILDKIVKPTSIALRKEGRTYKGILYVGLMKTLQGIKVLEFNCRMGDPEAQVIFPRIEEDIVPYLLAVADGDLSGLGPLKISKKAAVAIVLASKGYPGKAETGKIITGLETVAEMEDITVFHAGTDILMILSHQYKDGNTNTIAIGGRVVAVTALGKDLQSAREKAYAAVSKIHFDGMQYRTDIAARH